MSQGLLTWIVVHDISFRWFARHVDILSEGRQGDGPMLSLSNYLGWVLIKKIVSKWLIELKTGSTLISCYLFGIVFFLFIRPILENYLYLTKNIQGNYRASHFPTTPLRIDLGLADCADDGTQAHVQSHA